MTHTRIISLLAAAACVTPPSSQDLRTTREELLGSNALMTNALMTNALMTNALMTNALMTNALMTNALMTNALTSEVLRPDGFTEGELARQFLSYVYSCSMPMGSSMRLVFGDRDYGTVEGGLELAPEWGVAGGACNERCQRFVSACLLARTNFWGVPVQISLRGDHPSLIPAEDEKARYPLREGAYFGNLFVNTGGDAPSRPIFGCVGPGSNVPQLTHRFCSGGGALCAINVIWDCVNPATTHACARQDPNDGMLRDCYSGGVDERGGHGVHHDEVITVYLKEPVAVCGDGVCTDAESVGSCRGDCSTGWARGFTGDENEPLGFAPMPGEGQAVAVFARGSVDLGVGPVKALPGEPSLVLGRLDGAGNTLWSRQVAYGDGLQSLPRPAIAAPRADASGRITIAGMYGPSGVAWFGDTALPRFETGQASTFVARVSPDGELLWTLALDGFFGGYAVEPGGGVLVYLSDAAGSWLLTVSNEGHVSSRVHPPELGCAPTLSPLVLRDADGSLILRCGSDGLARWDLAAGTAAVLSYPHGEQDAPLSAAPGPDGDLYVLVREAQGTRVLRLEHDGALRWASLRLPRDGFPPRAGLAVDAATGEAAVFGALAVPETIGDEVLVPVGNVSFVRSTNVWVSKLRSDGGVRWVKQLGGLGDTLPAGAQLDAQGRVWITGELEQTGVFDGWIIDNPRARPTTFVVSVPDPVGK
jgi:hypothetical protein